MNQNAARVEDPLVILVVEDEGSLRQVVAMTLRRGSFDVIEAPDGATALEILASGAKIDALLTDIRMPGMSGYDVASKALGMRPGLPVILMTGFTSEEIPESIRAASVPVLLKPFNFARLADTIRRFIVTE